MLEFYVRIRDEPMARALFEKHQSRSGRVFRAVITNFKQRLRAVVIESDARHGNDATRTWVKLPECFPEVRLLRFHIAKAAQKSELLVDKLGFRPSYSSQPQNLRDRANCS